VPDKDLESVITRFRETRPYLWELVAIVVILALAINLLASAISGWLGNYFTLALGLLLGLACLVYVIYTRVRVNNFSIQIDAFFMANSETCEVVDIKDYEFANAFYRTYVAVRKENPVLGRQWQDEISGRHEERGSSDRLRIASEIAEYILLDRLSTHLTDYFNTPTLREDQLEVLFRKDVPDIVLSNRVLELISRDLEDRPWYKPGPDDDNFLPVSSYGPGGIYSRFDLTLPKGSTISRSSSGTLVIKSRMLTLELNAICDGYNYYVPFSFARYYLRIDPNEMEPLAVRFNIDAKIQRRFGLKPKEWPYYMWLESFVESTRKELGGKSFFEQISWSVTEVMIGILEKGGIFPATGRENRASNQSSDTSDGNGEPS